MDEWLTDEWLEEVSKLAWDRYGMRTHNYDMLRVYLKAAVASGELVPRNQLEQMGTWLDPAAYGPEHAHFTETKCADQAGVCYPLYRILPAPEGAESL